MICEACLTSSPKMNANLVIFHHNTTTRRVTYIEKVIQRSVQFASHYNIVHNTFTWARTSCNKRRRLVEFSKLVEITPAVSKDIVGVCGRLIIPSMCSMHDQTSSVDPVTVPWTCQYRCIYLPLACMTSNVR